MHQLKNGYLKVMEAINKLIIYLLALFLAIMVIIIFLQVFSRFILNDSIVWSEELARYLMIWGVFLGTAYATRYDLLIAVKVLPEFLPNKYKIIIHYIVQTLMVIFGLCFFYIGGLMTLKVTGQTSASLSISMAIPYSALPIGGILMVLNSIVTIINGPKQGGETT